ncbi:hypothetical protein BN906_02131 [Clostridium tetani 12124569]|nr:hypothetical protein BN906_02131 [Clostridium tetani 12124569]
MNYFYWLIFKQSSFEVDNKNVDKFTFNVKANKTLEIPVTIKNLEEGFHDVMFVVVKDPLNKSLDPQYRSTTMVSNMLYLRFSITIENDVVPQYSIISLEQKEIKDNFLNVVINKNKNNADNWLIETTNSGSMFNYYTHITNKDFNNKQKYAIITLLDSKQVEVNGSVVQYIEIDKRKEISMPCALKLPDVEGVHNLTTVVIPNPFEKNEINNKQIFSSVRVGLNLLENN